MGADKITYTLVHTVEHGNETITEIEIRPGRIGDLRGTKRKWGSDGIEFAADDLILVASRMCGQTPGVINKLEGADAGKVLGAAQGFLLESLASGDAE